ncbi:MAG TPA: response regulator [Kofleriaceae bacterium]|nr:response regulator [Kofleriaceae bacterium]
MPTGEPQSPRFRALVADDDEDTLDAVARAVERLGFTVTRASTGGELIEAFANHRFDLIVTDVSMPWMTGLQALHAVRTAGLGTPVVVMTALRQPFVDSQTSALGESAVLLRKPFGTKQLYAAIQKLLGPSVVVDTHEQF